MTPYQRWYFRALLLNALQKASGHFGRCGGEGHLHFLILRSLCLPGNLYIFKWKPQPAVTDPMPERAKEPDAPQAPSDAEDSEASEESAMEEDFPSNIAEKLAEAPEAMVFW